MVRLGCRIWLCQQLGIVVFCAGVGLAELHLSSCDSVPDVHDHGVVEVLELINEVLWIVFVSFVRHGLLSAGLESLLLKSGRISKCKLDSELFGSELILPLV